MDEDEFSDGIGTRSLWEGDDMTSGTDEDDPDGVMEEDPVVPPPPSRDDIDM